MQGKKILFVLAMTLFLLWGGAGSRPLAAQTQPILPSSFGAWTASGAATQVPRRRRSRSLPATTARYCANTASPPASGAITPTATKSSP